MNFLNRFKKPESEALAQKNLYEHDAKCNTDILALEAQTRSRRQDCEAGTKRLKEAIETAKSLETKAMKENAARLKAELENSAYGKKQKQIADLEAELKKRRGELEETKTTGEGESFFFAHARRRPMPRRQAARGMGQLPFYCVRCKAKTTGAGVQRSQTRKGQPMLRAQCSRCGTRVVRFVAKGAL